MKLLQVKATNFKLCEDNFTISFLPKANKTQEDKEFELHEIDEDLFVYKTVGIVGKNASGKTTSVDLLALVYDIFSNYRIKSTSNFFGFSNKVVNIDVTFYHEGFLYRYVTDLYKNPNIIDSTSILFKNQKLLKREYKKSHSKNLLDYEKYEEVTNNTDLPEDTSIIYLLLKDIELRGINYLSADISYHNYGKMFELYNTLDSNLKILESILKMFDDHILSIKMASEKKFEIQYTNHKMKEVSDIELYEILSSGTNKGLGLFGFVVCSLKGGLDLIIDEIEVHFHKTLVENLINLYKDKSVNKKNATLIFTTHYCELLDLFNRSDNIYISKYDKHITLENMYEKYRIRPELLKSKKFYENAFNTDVDYDSLMKFKKELM